MTKGLKEIYTTALFFLALLNGTVFGIHVNHRLKRACLMNKGTLINHVENNVEFLA